MHVNADCRLSLCILYSSGFDASMFHDENGRKFVVSLEWETREGYEKPGSICMVEYSSEKKEIIGYPKRIWRGGTDRGCIEAPHLTRRGEYYYIIQKSGHGSYVELPTGEVYLVHLCARPFVPELRCTLGRETAIQKMKWTEDGWLRMADGGNLAQLEVPESLLPEYPLLGIPDFDDFDSGVLGNWYYSPRIMPESFADIKARPGYVRIRGQESRTSLNRVSILARKLTSVYARVTTKMEFSPKIHQHSAGLIMYYDNMNYINLRKYYSESLGQSALSIIHLENGEKTEFLNTRIPVEDCAIYLRLYIQGHHSWFEWSYDGMDYHKIGRLFDTTRFSDEFCKYGEFTGTMVGMTCADRVKHQHYADFDFFEYCADESKNVE